SYEAVVRRYPASGYSDNALWNAGRLALDAFARFNQPEDQDTGERLLRKLVSMYPTSKLAKQVPSDGVPQPVVPLDVVHSRAVPAPAPATARPSSPPARVYTRIATIRSIRRNVLPDAVRVVIELDGEVDFHQERIPDPSRVFVDLPGTHAAQPLVDKTL